jgi:hypothetical protein
VAVLQVLSEVVGAEELLRLVALAKLVHIGQVLKARLPVGRRGKLLAAVAARVRGGRLVWRRVKGRLEVRQRRARPRVPAQVQAVLVPLRLVLVLEAVIAVRACVLLLRTMNSACTERGTKSVSKLIKCWRVQKEIIWLDSGEGNQGKGGIP